MAEVEVIKVVEGPIPRKRDYEDKSLVITRQGGAAYVRVSTDDVEQRRKKLTDLYLDEGISEEAFVSSRCPDIKNIHKEGLIAL